MVFIQVEHRSERVCLYFGEWTFSSGNGLLPDGTKPLPEPMLTYHQRGSSAFSWDEFWSNIMGKKKWVSRITTTSLQAIEICPRNVMMTSSNGNIFWVTGPLCEEFPSHRWIPHTKACDSELWCILWSAPWINGWVNNCEPGDGRHQCTHYDVTVMVLCGSIWQITLVCAPQGASTWEVDLSHADYISWYIKKYICIFYHF